MLSWGLGRCKHILHVPLFKPTIQLEQFTKYGFDYYVGYGIKRDDGEWVSIDFEF